MEQHYSHFKMPKTISEKSIGHLHLLDKVYFQQYLMSFSGIIPPTEADAVANLIINELSSAEGKPEKLDQTRRYIKDLPALIYSLDENTPFEDITKELKEIKYNDSDVQKIANLATRAAVSVRAGEYELSVTPNPTPEQLRAIKTLTETVKKQIASIQPK